MFGMSMMSMKPLFPAKGRGEGYRAACQRAEQQTMGQYFFIGEGNSATKKAPPVAEETHWDAADSSEPGC